MSAPEPPAEAAPAPPPPARPRAVLGAIAPGLSTAKLCLLGALLFLLLLPQYLIAGLIAERETRQEEARAEIAAAWGQPQTVLGPLLVLPYRGTKSAPGEAEGGEVAILPVELSAQAAIMPERRRRGLFEAVVYHAEVDLAARFAIAPALPEGAEPLWAEAYLITGASDLRPGAEAPRLGWDGRSLAPDARSGSCGGVELLHWPLRLAAPPESGRVIEVGGRMALRGTGSLLFRPLAARARLAASGAWQTPSYVGADLPQRTVLARDGFRAEWTSAMLRGTLPGGAARCAFEIAEARSMGVALLEAVPTYRMVNRAAKYALMFLALAFLTYLLFELVAGVRIHLVQYALLGCSVVLFPLLLLAIAEPLGFAAAYAIATAMVMAQASLYTVSVTGRALLALVFAGVLAALFGFLYVVLSLESLALLAGAVALFAALSLVMLATRRVAWGT